MCAFLNVNKIVSHVSQQRNKEAKKSSETDKQRTSNITEAGTIEKASFSLFKEKCRKVSKIATLWGLSFLP